MAADVEVSKANIPVACNLGAISAEDRPRYTALVTKLRQAVRERHELPDGYVYRLNGAVIGLSEVAGWMAMERLCCPFLRFELEASGGASDWMLTLTGPEGVKAILAGEFPEPIR